MPRHELPATPRVVRWARERAGFTLAEAIAVFPKIEEWELGKSGPTYSQLEALADRFKLPIAAFFFPEPPESPPIAESFRTLPESEFDRIPRRVRYLLRKAKAFQINLVELSHQRNPARRMITRDLRANVDISISAFAERVRRYIGIDIEEQARWNSVETALEHWRNAITSVGIYVFKDAFKADEFSGFCLYDDEFPLIYVNNSSSKSRQIFTLFHETAHLLFHTSGIDTLRDEYIAELRGASKKIEIACNRFAAEFLVPEAGLNSFIEKFGVTEEAAAEIAKHFNVSRELIFRKFLDRQLINQQTYARAAKKWASQKKVGSGGDYYNTQIAYLGSNYIDLALSQYYQNKIDEGQLAEYLGIAPKNLSAFEARYTRRG